ncbi:MAG: L-lactate permease [Acidobacteriaceae bacterium]|nr:L-lactate permease [Acidobacteriaceae bacterium]MBV9499806.1 L-lactate permease [Acidobacteriaceae bacterium]
MWTQNYFPVAHSLFWSALVAALPIAALLYAIGIRRVAAWESSVIGLIAALVVAVAAYRMPARLAIDSALYGAAFGTFPIFWVIFWAIVLYRLTEETGKFEILKDSISHLTPDRSLQALLIAFAFGAFLEGAAGFGTPVAVAAAILGGLGFSAFYAASICLLANTAPVAFGSIAIPLVTLAATTGLPLAELSKYVGRLCAPVSFFIPAYLILVMAGRRELGRVWPAALVCGASFAGTQFVISNFVGASLTDILSSLAAVVSMVLLLRVWRPNGAAARVDSGYQLREIAAAWSPYLLLVVFILAWSSDAVKTLLNQASISFGWPGLDRMILQVPPVVPKVTPYGAIYRFRYLVEAGTACCFASVVSAALLRVRPTQFVKLIGRSAVQLKLPFISITAVLALAFVMNYSGATGTLGLAFAATGKAFPYFSAMLGWLGVFLTGSDTSSNALFGNLQKVTATTLGFNPALMASTNSAGGVMGKMISLQSIAVAAAAAGLKPQEEPALFRFTLKHSILLASIVGMLATLYSYT